MRKYLHLIHALTLYSATTMLSTSVIADTLSHRDYRYFSQRMASTTDTAVAKVYAHSWLRKANNEKNLNEQLSAYRAVMHISPKTKRFHYADTLLRTAKLTGDNLAIGSAYLTVGAAYNHEKQYLKALDFYLVADAYVSRTNDQYLQHKVRYAIGNIKYFLGYYHEAIALLKECVEYFRDENDFAYLVSLHSVGLCYIGIDRFDLCTRTNELGIAASNELENIEMVPYFTHSEGINQYFKKNYVKSIELLGQSLPSLTQKKDFANETVTWFYLGKNYLALQRPENAIRYFRKVDNSVSQNNYIRPDLRENYELLIEYYKNKDDQDSLSFYVNRLLQVDKKLNTEYKYLIGKIFKEYDTNALLRTQKEIEQNRRRDIILFSLAIIFLLAIISFLTIQHVKNKKYYRRKFEELMSEQPSVAQPALNKHSANELQINPDIVAAVLLKIDKFEKKHKYIEKEMSLTKVAGYLDINTKYASQIIWHYRGKKFIDYINDLKIAYIVNLLKTEKMYRNYTNEALAEKAGFGSTQNFTRAFKDRTDISPTYFIEQLRKSSEND